MRCARLNLALHAACLGVMLLPAAVCAQGSQPSSALSEIPLPGGVPAALAVLNDPLPADRGQFLIEVIRRTYATPITARSDPRESVLRALLAHLERERRAAASPASTTIPLPLTPALWTDVIFGGRAAPDALAAAILESRSASLLYYGLMSLDDPTREWVASQRELLTELSTRHAAAFAVAAPGFRVADGRVRVPGGTRAEAAWEALVGRRAADPSQFLRALLTVDDGRIGYVLSAMSELTPAQISFALGEEDAKAAAALRRLAGAFDRSAPAWKINERTLWRPRRDPALLLSDLVADERGRPMLPGSRAFWTAVFTGTHVLPVRPAEIGADAADFAWLAEQVFAAGPAEQRRHFDAVLFASRVVKSITAGSAGDALEALHAAWEYPALAALLEHARAADVAVYAAAARRAARLSAIPREDRRRRALAQFQGTLALLARMVSRGSVTPAAFGGAVTSLSGLEWNRDGDYDGAVVRWFAGWIASSKPDARPDDGLMQLLAGPSSSDPRYVDWEGTRYKLDLSFAESARLGRLLGEGDRPCLSAALAAGGTAADEAWARAATELAYAAALGEPEHAALSAADIARRHDFGLASDFGRSYGPWTLPIADSSPRGYRIGGSLLGLEIALAEYSLTRISTKAPPRKPTVSSEERRVFVATVPLVQPTLLLDDDRDRIALAIRTARDRVSAIRSAEAAAALAETVPIGAVRRTLFPWIVAHDRPRAASFFAPVELLWMGLDGGSIPTSMDAWGVSAEARRGCWCLQVIDRRPGDMFSGRVNAGILASGFPDLGLRVAELLADLHMPAALFGGVLATATFDFVNGAYSRDEDDRRGLVEFVLALRADRVEAYLAMLTTGGPLVPPRDTDRLDGVAPATRRQP